MSETAAEALRSLTDHPSRSTASGIANDPYLVSWLSPAGAHDGLTELADRGLAVHRFGRWSLTDLGLVAEPQSVHSPSRNRRLEPESATTLRHVR